MNSKNAAAISIMSCSSEDLDNDPTLDHDFADLDISAVSSRIPHFLDYDAISPPAFEDDRLTDNAKFTSLSPATLNPKSFTNSLPSLSCHHGETVKVDKKYERDGEISDYELVANGIKMKEYKLHQQPRQELSSALSVVEDENYTSVRKNKHFLEKNSIHLNIAILNKEISQQITSSGIGNITKNGFYFNSREHRSLDRNFQNQQEYMNSKYERKHSLDREPQTNDIREYGNYSLLRSIKSEVNNSTNKKISSFVDERTKSISTLETSQYGDMTPQNIMNLCSKVECVYSLLSMLGTNDSTEMSKKFFELSRSAETCTTLRRCGCIPLLVQMMHSDSDVTARKRATLALHNVVHSHPDDKVGRREAKVLKLIEQIMEYCNFLKTFLAAGGESTVDDSDRHPLPAISSLMKVSFDEEHRHAMCQLGALHAIANLVYLDIIVHGLTPDGQCCYSLRRYALMALTNLTFGDGNNKALLCANKEFMESLIAQLGSAPDDLLQVTASVLRNLSWRADSNMKAVLNEIGTVTILAKAAMRNKNENTLKAILSALWNLSAHRSTNKVEFCTVEGALAFLVDMLTYEGPSKTLKIMENAGGILRNLSSHIAVNEDYRKILRQRNCLGILLQHLKSESLTVVSNACGILWNLSARCAEDQKFLWDNGAVPMLRSLIHSKHKMISEGSRAALKNLLGFRPGNLNQTTIDPVARSLGLKDLPSLNARKQKALEQELNQNLAEARPHPDNSSPTKETNDFPRDDARTFINKCNKPQTANNRSINSGVITKSNSRGSLESIKSDSTYDKISEKCAASQMQTEINKSEENVYKGINSVRYLSVTSKITSGSSNRLKVGKGTDKPNICSEKYNEIGVVQNHKSGLHSKRLYTSNTPSYTSYQETDLDQPTDFSLKYSENQTEFEAESKRTTENTSGNEIILIMEDTIKCYQTEDTPYVISNAGSSSDLRCGKLEESVQICKKRNPEAKERNTSYAVCETFTPEKPINYCEEGTPSYFSRYESLSSLDESPSVQTNTSIHVKPEIVAEDILLEKQTHKDSDIKKRTPVQKRDSGKLAEVASVSQSRVVTGACKSASSINSAHETPLMFSRHSSMDSLTSVEPVTADDKSSVVSDLSRLASGIISPSEIPDSPTQSMPHSPRRNSNSNIQYLHSLQSPAVIKCVSQARLRSVFEDEVNTFQVENTPAQFSCATSLSNLSLEDEAKIVSDGLSKALFPIHRDELTENYQSVLIKPKTSNTGESCTHSEAEDEINNDDMLLATCINIGMNCVSSMAKYNKKNPNNRNVSTSLSGSSQDKPITSAEADILKQYCTEDTPALLSKVGSNSSLSALSHIGSKDENVNLSDDSSNTSDGGIELLQQCIRDGMDKSPTSKEGDLQQASNCNNNPIVVLRSNLSPCLSVRDEMNKYVVEGSPCNISLISGLSSLTIDSNVTSVANIRSTINNKLRKNEALLGTNAAADDSISSISNESEEDKNLLTQVITAGYSNPRFSDLKIAQSPSHSSAVLLPSKANAELLKFHHQLNDGNESLSSMESNDSSENQTDTLLEHCIRSGMLKQKKHDSVASKLAIVSPKRAQLPALSPFSTSYLKLKNLECERKRERERKDEQLLEQCISVGMASSTRSSYIAESKIQKTELKPSRITTRQIIGQTNNPSTHLSQQRKATRNSLLNNKISNLPIPKNVKSTSAVVLKQAEYQELSLKSCITLAQHALNTTTDVGKRELQEGTSSDPENLRQIKFNHQQQIKNITGFNRKNSKCINFSAKGVSVKSNELLECKKDYMNSSIFNVNLANEISTENSETTPNEPFFLERVKYLKDLYHNKKGEFSLQQQENIENKQKDPDLMLKSVERLTKELVSTAEYLRRSGITLNYSDEPDSQEIENDTLCEKKYHSNSNSNNTWNEDTCPDDVSFPSISLTAPIVASLNDDEVLTSSSSQPSHVDQNLKIDLAEITPTNEVNPIIKDILTVNNTLKAPCPLQQKSITTAICAHPFVLGKEIILNKGDIEDSVHNTNTSTSNSDYLLFDKLSDETNDMCTFPVGGKVQQQSYVTATSRESPARTPINCLDTLLTKIKSSTVVTKKRNLVVQNLTKNMSNSTSSLDLDNIRPPSCMETLSKSGCFEMPAQNLLVSENRRKPLPSGLLARRAISNGLNGTLWSGGLTPMRSSMESISSNSSLDNIKPPSLMDELLDSMISVESITSEIVENQNVTLTKDNTNYEGSFSDVDENSATLQNYVEAVLSTDNDSNGTSIPSDFSSCESTPQKDRDSSCSNNINGIQRALAPKQKRKFVRDRYKTYTIAADFVLKEDSSEDVHVRQEQPILERIETKFEEKDKILLGAQLKHQDNRSKISTKEMTEFFMLNNSRFQSLTPNDDFTINTSGENKSKQSFLNMRPETLTSTEEYPNELLSIRVTSNYENDSLSKLAMGIKSSIPACDPVKSRHLVDEMGTAIKNDYVIMDCKQNPEADLYEQRISLSCSSKGNNNLYFMKTTKLRDSSDKDLGTEEQNFYENEMNMPTLEAMKKERGRKKSVYISPYKKTTTSGKSTKNLFRKAQINDAITREGFVSKNFNSQCGKICSNSISKNQVFLAKAQILTNKTSCNKNINVVKNSRTKPGLVPKEILKRAKVEKQISKRFSKDTKPAMPLLSRQGTFVKNEPIKVEIPMMLSLPTSPVKMSKLPTKINVISSKSEPDDSPITNLSHNTVKIGSIVSKLRIPTQKNSSTFLDENKFQIRNSKFSSLITRTHVDTSTGPTSEILETRTTSISVGKSTSDPTAPRRSNSNVSLRSFRNASLHKTLPAAAPTSKSNSNIAVRPNISSRIAGIWKKTYNTKKSFCDKELYSTNPLPTDRKLIRSSTFDSCRTEKDDRLFKKQSIQSGVEHQASISNSIISSNTPNLTQHPKSSVPKNCKSFLINVCAQKY